METLTRISRSDNLGAFDTVLSHGKVGSARESILLHTEKGATYVPASIVYFQDESGERYSASLSKRFSSRKYEYALGKNYTNSADVVGNIIHDEKAGLQVLGIPLNQDSVIFSATNVFDVTKSKNTPIGELLHRISFFYPKMRFGLFGSFAIGLEKDDSDLDLYVQGGEAYQELFKSLHDLDVQQQLGVVPYSELELTKYMHQYAKQFKISDTEAMRLAKLRNRYKALLENGKLLKVGFSSNINSKNVTKETLFGSKAIKSFKGTGVVLDSTESASFPRIYRVEIDGYTIPVLSIIWTHRRMVLQGDIVNIKGTLREKDGNFMISLDEPEDYILRMP